MSLDKFYGIKICHKCVCSRGCALNPAGEPYSASPNLPAAFEPFGERGDGRAESGVYHYSKSQHIILLLLPSYDSTSIY